MIGPLDVVDALATQFLQRGIGISLSRWLVCVIHCRHRPLFGRRGSAPHFFYPCCAPPSDRTVLFALPTHARCLACLRQVASGPSHRQGFPRKVRRRHAQVWQADHDSLPIPDTPLREAQSSRGSGDVSPPSPIRSSRTSQSLGQLYWAFLARGLRAMVLLLAIFALSGFGEGGVNQGLSSHKFQLILLFPSQQKRPISLGNASSAQNLCDWS